ncbi:glucan endo-1,3-beta-glucosidase-like [Silene latifolia]|uniref:glucan endo-1,3-beta-glucosidase-like n=1 Tax=Silene latifolia TaxID=37657 RepID=UPI003D786379
MKINFIVVLASYFLLSLSPLIDGAQVGICYGTVASNLPPPPTVVSVLQSNGIGTVRIFKPDPEVLQSFSGSGIRLMIGVPNEVLPSLAQNAINYSSQWLQDNIFAYIPPTQVKYLAVGNEIFLKDPYFTPFLVPSIKNLNQALISLNLDQSIKLSSPQAACVLTSSFPPSNGTFNPELLQEMSSLLKFLHETDSPFMVNVYPFLSYVNNPKDIGLDYVLFNSPNVMDDNGIFYNNLFDATLDSFVAAMEREGFGEIELVVSETGWPTAGYEAAGLENARVYNENVVKRALGNVGTPKRPGVGMEVFLFDLFDEDKKNGDEYEKHFGVFGLSGAKIYDVCFT